MFKIKLNKKKTAAVIFFMTAATFFSNKVSAEEESINIPGAIMLLSLDTWKDRNLRVIGQGTANALIYGGKQDGNLYNVSINPKNQPVNFYGGYYDGILKNEVENITGNQINLFDGNKGWLVYDDPNKVNDSYNRVHVFSKDGENLNLNLIAGHGGLGEVYGNSISIYGGTVTGTVTPAESKVGTENFSARLHDNDVNIYGNADLTLAKLYGAALFSDDTREHLPTFGTNNALNVYTKNIAVAELTAFNNYNFYLPENVKNQDTIITVTGENSTDISGSKIYAVIPKNATLATTDKVTLINNNSGITSNAATSYLGVNSENLLPKWYPDISTEADIIVDKIDENNVVLSFKANRLTPPTKLIPESRVPIVINQFADMISGNITTIEAAGAQIFTPFYAITSGSMKYKTGSYVKARGTNLIVGFSRKIENPTRRILIAPLIEYGRGNYDSYLDGGEHGHGHNRNLGVGIVFSTKLSDGKFYDGSIRAGRIKTDFESDSFGVFQNVHETFKTNSPYIGAHLGIGREVKHSKKEIVTYSLKFLYSHTGAENMTLATGENYHLGSVNSYRIKLGIQEEYEPNNIHNFYFGAGLEYEFNGKAYAEHGGLRTDTPSTKGASGIFEFGWIIKPRGDEKFSLDLSGVGSVGKNRGLTGRFAINWRF